MNADEIFLAAVEKATPAERAAYLDGACADNPELRARVEGLLQSHEQAGSFLQQPLFDNLATVSQPLTESPGTIIGPYRLLQQIGEGGFGVVFMAEQTAPVKRKVALKVIKPGMDTKEVIARFEAERQALALMDHPNIAKVLDAGATDTGRPFFVMELVRGVPITEYCDQAQLTPRQRLELFVTVCHAVQHAHQKGIIHRDIKPTNVLVTLHDDRPVVKVIDFGVAKATSGQLTDKTLFTGFAQMIGTPLYMSPEQAALSAIDIDTRSDIYSLGVLLYELLTGTTPFDKTRMQQAAFDEVRRIIREEEPQKPSTRLSSLADTLPSVSAVRRTEPRKLSQLVRGDLDWIVMKALEKDRTRRYETANGFAADVLRYLSDETVTACPPSATYRFRKFARRNKVALATGAMVAAVLVAGIIGTTWQAIRATHEATRATNAEALAEERYEAEKTAREQADAARAAESEQRQIAQDETRRAEENFDKARRAVDEYLSQVTESELLTVPGLQPLREDLLRAALTFYAEFTQERADDPTIQRELASAHFRLGRIHAELGEADAAAGANNEAIRLYEQLRDAGQFDPDAQVALATAYFSVARYDDTVKLCQDALAAEPGHAAARSLLANTWNNLGNAVDDNADIGAALKYHRQAFELRESLVRDAPDNPRCLAELGGTENNLGNLLYKQGNFAEALAMYERAVQYTEQAYERAPHSLLWGRWLGICVSNVARTQSALGQEQEALTSFQRFVAVTRKRVFENPAVTSLRGDLSQAHLTLARYQQQLGNTGEAARSFREAREVLENIPRETADQLYELATVYAALAQPFEGALEPTEEDVAEQERNIDLALETLYLAIDAGFSDAGKLRLERLFDVIRERDDFQRLLTALESAAEAQRLAGRNSGSDDQTLADRLRAAELLSGAVADQPGSVRHRRTLAATLHSIAVIQTGLKQFAEAEASLRDSLRIREELLLESPTELELQVDRLTARIALGNLYWSSARHPEAHQLWQESSRELLAVADADRDNAALQQRIAEQLRLICDAYGKYALWPLAGEYVQQSSKFRPMSADIQNAEFAALLLLPENADAADSYLAMLAEATSSFDDREAIRTTHLVRTAALADSSAVTEDELVSRAREALVIRNGDGWSKTVLALALWHAGQVQEADELVRELGQPGGHAFWRPQVPFVQAIMAAAVGDQSTARAHLARAEALYREVCLETVDYPAVDSLGLPARYWHDLIYIQAQRREALRLVEGQEPGDDPWQHLIQARGYRLIGDVERADRELAAALAAAPDDAKVWMARARLLTQWDDQERSVEAEWQRAVELAGDDPMPWIHRGRWHAERGESENADADFARAASLTPDELNRFLEAGWWIVGPYPANLDEFCPPETDPDPSQPVYVIDPTSGLSDEPVRWRQFAGGTLEELENRTDASVYALTYVYSPDERTALMRVGGGKGVRLWCNDTLVFASDRTRGSGIHAARVPVALHPGRNVLLLKTAGDPPSKVQLGDSPIDRACLFAEQGLWDEAAEQLLLDGGHSDMDSRLLLTLAESGHEDDFHRLLRERFARFFPTARDLQFTTLVEAVGVIENPLLYERGDEIISRVETVLVPVESEYFSRGTLAAAWVALLLDRVPDATRILERLDSREAALAPSSWPVHALFAEKTGDHQDAQKWLQQCFERYPRLLTDRHFWCDRLLMTLRLRTAERLMTGSTGRSDAIFDEAREQNLREFHDRSPLLAAFDHRVQADRANSDHAHFGPGDPYLDRGRRLAELGRMDEAEADFNKAVELAPHDPDVLSARGVFLADSGEPVRAAADFHAALDLLDEDSRTPRWRWGVPIDLKVAQSDELFDQLAVLRPDDPRTAMTRMAVHVQQGDFDGLRLDAERLASYPWSDPAWSGAAALCRGDRAAFDRIRERASRNVDPVQNVQLLGLAPTEEPVTTELLQIAERMWREAPQTRWYRRWLGLAQLRAGQYSEAVASLEASLASSDRWQIDGVHWPLLAIAHHHLGNTDAARRWLDKTALWLELRSSAESRQVGAATGVRDIDPASLLHAMAFFLEARALIDGPEAADAARALLAAQGRERNEAAEARAEARQQQMLARAEADWQRAVELAGDDPLVWIQRGRWYAERGEQEKSDADFAHAASLTPDKLNTFLEAGWWVVGPYPAELREFCPPEIDPDPSRPVHVIDPQSGISNEPARWISVPTGANGAVDLSAVSSGPADRAVYALAHIWSPDERSVLLMLGKTEPIRVWVNSVLVEAFTPGEYAVFPDYELYHRVPVALTTGRNTVLIKCESSMFTVRIGDTPRDRAILLAEQRRFGEAGDALQASALSPDDLQSGHVPWQLAPVLATAGSEHKLYQQYCAAAIARSAEAESQAWLQLIIPYVCSQRPNDRFDEHAERVILFAEQYAADASATWPLPRLHAALANCRAGQYARAQSLLTEVDRGQPISLPLQALLHHQLGDAASAVAMLENAFGSGAECVDTMQTVDRSSFSGLNWACWWHEWALFLNLLTEAEQAIRGETTAADQLRADADATQVRRWTESPELVAFDHAVLFNACGPDGYLKYPQSLLTRGRRLAELGRIDEAEVDFNKAVELAPDDVEVLLARARFHAESGNVPRAGNDFQSALGLALAQIPTQGDAPRLLVEREIGLHEAVLDEWQTRSDHARDWRIRGERQIQLGNWTEAVESLEHGRHSSHELLLALLYSLLGDVDACREACREHAELLSGEVSGWTDYLRLYVSAICPAPGDAHSELTQIVEARLADPPDSRWKRFPVALALYRLGRYDEALPILDAALEPQQLWQHDAPVWPLLAMTHWQLGRHDESRKWLDRSAWWIDLASRAVDVRHAIGPDNISYHDWLAAHVFYAEAKVLIEDASETQEDNPQVRRPPDEP